MHDFLKSLQDFGEAGATAFVVIFGIVGVLWAVILIEHLVRNRRVREPSAIPIQVRKLPSAELDAQKWDYLQRQDYETLVGRSPTPHLDAQEELAHLGESFSTLNLYRNSSEEDVRRAYATLFSRYHPRTNKPGEGDPAKLEEITAAFEEIMRSRPKVR